jgi:hypothetical protein
LLITRQITREYQQGEGFSDVREKKEGMILNLEITLRKEKMLTSFLAIFLKLITNPALLAGLIAFLQKSLHP